MLRVSINIFFLHNTFLQTLKTKEKLYGVYVTLQRMGLMHSLLFIVRHLKNGKLRHVCISFIGHIQHVFLISDNTWKLFPKLVKVVWNCVSANFQWHRGTVDIPATQPRLTKPEHGFCAGSTPVRRVSVVCDGKNLLQMIRLEIVLDTFSVYRIINLHHCNHWNSQRPFNHSIRQR